jgi:hypothetical protein
MKTVQINYNKNSTEIVGWSEDIETLNIGDIVDAKIVELTDEEFEELKNPNYNKQYKDKVIIEPKDEAVDIEKQQHLIDKLKSNSLTTKERDELLLLLVNKI